METVKKLLIKGIMYSYEMDTLAFGYLTNKLK